VLYIHDLSDINIYLVKIFVDTKFMLVAVLFYVLLLGTWGYLRLYVFPAHVIKSVIWESDAPGAIGDGAFYFFIIGLCSLLVLHCYWYFKLIQMGLHLAMTGERTDTQANFEAKLNKPLLTEELPASSAPDQAMSMRARPAKLAAPTTQAAK